MAEETKNEELQQRSLPGFEEPPKTVVQEFYYELGLEMGRLDKMLRSPTELRPFVYEVRLDLWPASNNTGLAVLKGFGENGSIVAFQDGSGLLGLLRGAGSRLHAGKLKWKPDEYEANSYGKRLETYLSDVDYRMGVLASK